MNSSEFSKKKGRMISSYKGVINIHDDVRLSLDVDYYIFVLHSAVVDISGRMGVSAVHAEAGILVNSSLYTVTSIKGNATYSQGEILKFEIGVPEDPVQFVNVS